jgi:hypothetical protein
VNTTVRAGTFKPMANVSIANSTYENKFMFTVTQGCEHDWACRHIQAHGERLCCKQHLWERNVYRADVSSHTRTHAHTHTRTHVFFIQAYKVPSLQQMSQWQTAPVIKKFTWFNCHYSKHFGPKQYLQQNSMSIGKAWIGSYHVPMTHTHTHTHTCAHTHSSSSYVSGDSEINLQHILCYLYETFLEEDLNDFLQNWQQPWVVYTNAALHMCT